MLSAHRLRPIKAFHRCVARYPGRDRAGRFSPWDRFLTLTFAQLPFRDSPHDIETCLGAVPDKFYDMGFRSCVRPSTLADADARRDWRSYAELGQIFIAEARELYVDDALDLDPPRPATYAILRPESDSTHDRTLLGQTRGPGPTELSDLLGSSILSRRYLRLSPNLQPPGVSVKDATPGGTAPRSLDIKTQQARGD